MAELQKGTTFSDGMVVNAATLNNLVDLGIALEGLISDKTDTVPAAGDYVLFWKSGTLFKCKFSELPAQVSSVGLYLPPTEFNITGSPVTTSGTLSGTWKNFPQAQFLASPTNGTGPPSFRVLWASDMAIPSVTVAASVIDWSLGNVFFKQLTTSTGFPMSFSNVDDGQTIQVLISHGVANSTVIFPGGLWYKGAAYPVQTLTAGPIDIWTLTAYGGGIFVKGDMDYQII